MQLTADQETKLAMIKNPQQREMLLDAIRQGMEIPEYAWQPFPADLDMDEMFAKMDEVTEEIADDAGLDASQVASALMHEFQREQSELEGQVGEDDDSFTCPVCHLLCMDREPCKHLAMGRFDDGDGCEARGVFYCSSDEITVGFDQLYDTVVRFAIEWLKETEDREQMLEARTQACPEHADELRRVVDTLRSDHFKPDSVYDFEDKVPMEFYDFLTRWFTELFKSLWNQQPSTVAANDYEIVHSPGLTWTGTNYWATNGRQCLTAVRREIDEINHRLQEAIWPRDAGR